MTNPNDRPSKDSFYLVELRYGEKDNYSYHRITDWPSDVTPYGEPTYSSVEAFEVDPGKVAGDLSDQGFKLKVHRGDSGFFHRISNGEQFSRIKVVARQGFRNASQTEYTYLFRGWVKRIVRNADGRKGLVRLECVTFKSKLDLPLGMGANPRCPWTFGDKSCKAVPGRETGLLTVVDGSTVTITGLSSHIDSYWHRGYVEYQGMRLTIRGWSGDTFQLSRKPPNDWISQNVTVVEGCDKRIKTCRDDKDRENRFGGIGKAIPKHNPMFENPNG